MLKTHMILGSGRFYAQWNSGSLIIAGIAIHDKYHLCLIALIKILLNVFQYWL
jgi:hypothetical protein